MTEYYYFGMKKSHIVNTIKVNTIKHNFLIQTSILIFIAILCTIMVESKIFNNNCLHECQSDYNFCQNMYFMEHNHTKDQCIIGCVNEFKQCYYECSLKEDQFEFELSQLNEPIIVKPKYLRISFNKIDDLIKEKNTYDG